MKNDNIQGFHLSITVVWKFLNRPHYWLCNKHILKQTSFTHTHTQTQACVCVCASACVCITSSTRKRTQNVLQKICRQATTLPQLQALRDSQLSVNNCPLRLLLMKFLKLHIERLEPEKSHQVRTFVTKITWKTPIKKIVKQQFPSKL